MALTKPYLLNIPAFDADKLRAENGKITVSFQYTGPNESQITGNRLTIYKRSDLTQVYQGQEAVSDSQTPPLYDETVNQLNLTHTIDVAKSDLQNGCAYYATVTVFSGSEESAASDTVDFYCFTAPSLSVLNEELQNNGVIRNSNFTLNFSYRQKEGIPPEEYIVTLYDEERTLITSIQEKNGRAPVYDEDSQTYQMDFSVPITGLVNEQRYFIGIRVITQYGMEVSLGETQADSIEFSVQYLRPSRLFAIVDLTNQPEEGNIRIASNIISIEGSSIPDPAEYEGPADSPRNIILNKDGYSATFDKGFSIRDDFTLQMVCKSLTEYEIFCELTNAGQTIAFRYVKDLPQKSAPANQPSKYHVEMEANDGIYRTVICSNRVTLDTSKSYLYLWFEKRNHLFDLKIRNSDGEEAEAL